MVWFLAFQLSIGPAQHYENAKQSFAERKFAQADSELNAALHESPYMVPALVLKARIATFANRPDVAKSCLITAITGDPGSEDAQFYLGVLYYTQNDFKSAISPLETAEALSPKSPLPLFYLAMTHEALGEESQALELYQKAESLTMDRSSQRAEILVVHGKSLLSLGRTEESIAKDREAIAADRTSRDAHYELAKGFDHAGDFKNAALEAETALTLPDLGTSDTQIHYLLVNLYRKLKQPDLAQGHMDKFLAAQKAAAK